MPNGRRDRAFVTIGNPDIISRRDRRLVPVEPGGSLSDYIPFYFTPFSPMAFNIKTGHGVEKVERYQAEALIYRHLPIDMLEVIVCNRREETVKTRALVDTLGADVKVSHSATLYF